ncbi:MAG: flagellar protein FlaG [Calditrichaeota bacterium]|nr:MAG: flagellar protein FlaG [Calditrichota bacterium]
MISIESIRLTDRLVPNSTSTNSPPKYGQALANRETVRPPTESKSSPLQNAPKPESGESQNALKLSDDEIKNLVDATNKTLKEAYDKELSFFVDEKTGKQGVRIIDIKTQKVIKQIPPEELLKLAARLREQIGALVDEHI